MVICRFERSKKTYIEVHENIIERYILFSKENKLKTKIKNRIKYSKISADKIYLSCI